MYHKIFLLDYDNFRQQALPFIEMADKGEYLPIVDKAKEIASNIPPEKWILEDLGTSLRGFSEFRQKGMSSQITGFSFLILLSQSLEELPFPSPGLGNVAQVAASFGWNKRDVDLLSKGMTTTALLKPALVEDVLERPPATDSKWYDPAYYWWWLRPENAFYVGWWDIQQIERLQDMLLEDRGKFEQADIEKLNLHPSVMKKNLLDDYIQTIKLFELAKQQQSGLLSITK